MTGSARQTRHRAHRDLRATVEHQEAENARLQPVRVTTVDQLDALPAETLIEHGGEVFRNRAFCRTWQEVSGNRYDHDAENVLPAVVLWTPDHIIEQLQEVTR